MNAKQQQQQQQHNYYDDDDDDCYYYGQLIITKPTELGRLDEGMTAVMHEIMDLKCAGLTISGITASQNP